MLRCLVIRINGIATTYSLNLRHPPEQVNMWIVCLNKWPYEALSVSVVHYPLQNELCSSQRSKSESFRINPTNRRIAQQHTFWWPAKRVSLSQQVTIWGLICVGGALITALKNEAHGIRGRLPILLFLVWMKSKHGKCNNEYYESKHVNIMRKRYQTYRLRCRCFLEKQNNNEDEMRSYSTN